MEGLLVTPIYFQIKVFFCALGRSGQISHLLTFKGQKKKWRSEDRPRSFCRSLPPRVNRGKQGSKARKIFFAFVSYDTNSTLSFHVRYVGRQSHIFWWLADRRIWCRGV